MSYRSPRQSLSKAYLKSPVSRPEIEQFKTAFVTMQNKIDPDKREDHLKNNIRDFLLNAYYNGDYEINIKGDNDLVIHNGPKSSDPVGVIIEAKSVKNTTEMISRSDLNKKALRELILYYLREREDEKNINIKHLIITNAVEWFVFDENDFEKLIFRNSKFLKQYKEYKLSGKDTKHFYDAIAKPFIETIKEDLSYAYFDVSKYQKVITNEDEKDDVKLVALYKLLSPIHILKKPFSNDSNSLNKDFYNELLHIIGLEEVKEKGKKVIQRKQEGKREPASLVENTINILKHETNVAVSKRYETALELCITWINRILFLKLLESQLVKYHKGDQSFEFLNYKKVADYDTLNRLFFQVLAIRPEDRRPRIKEEYANVPYLNSSLFEVNELEGKTLKISNLEDRDLLSIDSKTVLKGEKGKRATGSINTLEYLFKFLEAYNFSSEGGEQIQEESKTLINASVLGLIFEKINGYKDGSFFTPGFITMYMCKETIRRAVIQKFKDHTDFESEDWDELKNFIGRPYKKDELKEYNKLIDSLKICDPAVGSGHFLVSALNEIIAIKSELQILCDGDFVKLPVLASVDNDELIIENDNEEHDLYEYDYTSSSSRTIQRAIFEEKQKLIENCLFGVDINPNSVKICRLRLWIELLKNAYYTEESKYTDLETLPNIDINIKCGNSLISRFDLDSDLKPALKKSKFSIDSYKAAVASYKDATNKEAKHEFKRLIEGIKNDFRSEVRSKELIDLQKLEGQFYERFGQATLIDVELTKKEAKKKAEEQKKLIARIDKKKNEIEEVKNNQIYENAFEWRFEFPEILDEDGVFIGFDVVIGNPPYIRQEEFTEIKPYLQLKYNCFNSVADLFTYFIELGLKLNKIEGLFSFILPNKFLKATYGKEIRKLIKENAEIKTIYDFDDYPVFEEATTYPLIYIFKSGSKTKNFIFSKIDKTVKEFPLDALTTNEIMVSGKSLHEDGEWNFVSENLQKVFNKIKSNSKSLSEYVDKKVFLGIKTGKNEAFIISKEVRDNIIQEDSNSEEIIKTVATGQEIRRYCFEDSYKYLLFTQYDLDIKTKYPAIYNWLKQFEYDLIKRGDKGKKWWNLRPCDYYEEIQKPKIIWRSITNKCGFYLDDKGELLLSNNNYFIASDSYSLIGLLNSKMSFVFLKNICTTLQGGFFDFRRDKVLKIPIPLNIVVDREIANAAKKAQFFSLELFHILSNFMNLIKSRFDIVKASKRLQNWHKLDFGEFLNELEKARKKSAKENNIEYQKLLLSEEAEWVQFFKDQKQKVKKLKTEIDETDREIDQMVYELYSLTEEEIKIVQENI